MSDSANVEGAAKRFNDSNEEWNYVYPSAHPSAARAQRWGSLKTDRGTQPKAWGAVNVRESSAAAKALRSRLSRASESRPYG